MPPNIELLPFLVLLLLRVPQIVLYPGKGAAKFFSVLQGAVNQKRLKNTALDQIKIVQISGTHGNLHLLVFSSQCIHIMLRFGPRLRSIIETLLSSEYYPEN